MVKDSGAAFTACGRRHSKVEEVRSPTAFGDVMPSLACTTCARRFRAALAAAPTKPVNPRLARHAAIRRLAAKSGPNALERLLREVIAHQATAFEDDDDSLESIDGDRLVTFIADWRKRLVDFVNTHNGVE